MNYWSHDTRTFKQIGGIQGVTMTVYKYMINELGQYIDANGNVSAEPVLIAAPKSLDVTKYVAVEGIDSKTPKGVWDDEIRAQLGKDSWTEQEAQTCTHANKYELPGVYKYNAEINDPDFDFDYEFKFKIYIGVKGDYDLDNHVTAEDAQSALMYYVNKLANKPIPLNADPELDGEDGLIFFLINVKYRNGDNSSAPLENPQRITADDAQLILMYYVHHLANLNDHDWNYLVGYDCLDYFYGDVIQ
jgi:hypothetical protein